MSQVVLTGRLESIEDGFGEAIFRGRIADEDKPAFDLFFDTLVYFFCLSIY